VYCDYNNYRRRAESAGPGGQNEAVTSSGQLDPMASDIGSVSFRISPYSTRSRDSSVEALLRDKKDFAKQNFFLTSAKNTSREQDKWSSLKTEHSQLGSRKTEQDKSSSLKREPNKGSSLKPEEDKPKSLPAENDKKRSLKRESKREDSLRREPEKRSSSSRSEGVKKSVHSEPGRRERGEYEGPVLTYSNRKVVKSTECIDELIDEAEDAKGRIISLFFYKLLLQFVNI
jgi:hypothetical protein